MNEWLQNEQMTLEWMNKPEWMSDSVFNEWFFFKRVTPVLKNDDSALNEVGEYAFFLPSLKFCLIIVVNKECYTYSTYKAYYEYRTDMYYI